MTTPDLPDVPDLCVVLAAIQWAGSRLSEALVYPRGSDERARALDDLRIATQRARDLLEQYPGRVSYVSRVVLLAAELGLRRMARPVR